MITLAAGLTYQFLNAKFQPTDDAGHDIGQQVDATNVVVVISQNVAPVGNFGTLVKNPDGVYEFTPGDPAATGRLEYTANGSGDSAELTGAGEDDVTVGADSPTKGAVTGSWTLKPAS